MEKRFGTSSPHTIGVEEEFQLVDPSTWELAPAIGAVLEAAPSGSERLAPELFQDCVELRTPVFSNVAELARYLPALRGEVAQAAEKAGVGIAASGLHPISDPFFQRITPGERYERMEEELGSLAWLQIIYALHVHVAVPDAEAAIRRGAYRVGLYDALGSIGATAGLARDLFSFVEEQEKIGGTFTTFVASFAGPNVADEADFERLLWAQLQLLHKEDRRHHRWAPCVSSDSEDPEFAFSFAERAFFVVGLHPASSRFARRFAWPTLVFNPHHQFDRLREEGRYARMQEVIRSRERKLQGSLNPNLADFGVRSEARQYSGRPAEEGWRCPFHAGGRQNASNKGDAK